MLPSKMVERSPTHVCTCACDYTAHHAKTDLNKKSGAIHQDLIFFNIDAQGFRKTKNENPQTREMGVTS